MPPLIDAFDSHWEIQLKNSNPSYISNPNYQESISNSSTTINNWHHLVCINNANNLEFYINGVLTDQFFVSSLINNIGSSPKYYFGASPSGAPQFFDGILDSITRSRVAFGCTLVARTSENRKHVGPKLCPQVAFW